MTLEYSISVKLLTEHHLEFLAAEARPSLHMSKCHIVGNLVHWLKYQPMAEVKIACLTPIHMDVS